jgi:tetratricopeptide (TPR) repeat protein
MNKARRDATKKKSAAQKAATHAKKRQAVLSAMQVFSPPEVVDQTESTDSPRALFVRATTTMSTATAEADYGTVIDLLRRAIRIDPHQVDYFIHLASAYAHAGQQDFALAASELALRLEPHHRFAAENRRQALKALGLPETTRITLDADEFGDPS